MVVTVGLAVGLQMVEELSPIVGFHWYVNPEVQLPDPVQLLLPPIETDPPGQHIVLFDPAFDVHVPVHGLCP